MPTEEFIVSPGPGEPLDFYTYLYLEERQRQLEAEQAAMRQREEEERRQREADPAFAPPVVPLPQVVPPAILTPGVTGLGSLLRGVLWFLIPQPMGPREHDELDEFDVMAPPLPPAPPPPAATDPIMPPNWNDMLEWPGTPRYVPILPTRVDPVEMPPGEPEVIVSPPKPTTKPTIPDEVLLPDVTELPDYVGIDYRPGPAPAPTGTPGGDPVLEPIFPDIESPGVPELDRPGTIAPDIFSDPLPDVVGNPFADPFTPSPVPAPPRTDIRTPTVPDFLTPTFTPTVVPEPILTQFQPKPLTAHEQCDCAPKKKKKKDKKDRTVCYRGTYTETKRGLSKKKLEEIPCEAAPRATKAKKTTPKTKPTKPGQFPGLGLLGGMSGSDVTDLFSHAVKEFAPIVTDYLKRRLVPKKEKKPKRNRKPKTRGGRLPGEFYSSPFTTEF